MNGMSYQVLARKWRPRIFREMVGQEHVLQALINALDHNRLHHAYLFTGTRGVGKTTIARILAKCLNCETGVSSEPCGQCSACREIAEGRFIDLIEVDAASRTKVEDTRELLENVQYLPTRGRYKVYLIDEVHMLSNSSFNALLKTLEEPPPHVKFLLATTDPQKLPMTILSRCLQFNLKNMNPERIVGHLKFVLDQEVIPFEEAALWQLGRAADGSMRDALSLTDQAISYGAGKVTEQEVATMLGTLDQAAVYDIVAALVMLDAKAVLNAVQKMSEQAPDYAHALGEMLSILHRIAIAQALPEAVDNSHGDQERILQFALQIPSEDVQLFYQTALLGRRDLPLAPDSRGGFEMVLLRMLAFKPQGVLELPTQSLQKIAVTEPKTLVPEPKVEDVSPKKYEAVAVQTAEKMIVEAAIAEDWPTIYAGLGVTGILQSTIANCQLVARHGNEFHFILDEKNNTLYDPSHQLRLADLLSHYFHETVSVRIEKGIVSEKTPAMIALQHKQERQKNAIDAIKTDPIVLQLIDQLGATVREDSIQPRE
jgi:DNA polymerase III subunit gamma/tau